MLRKLPINTLFTQANQTRNICLKQCGKQQKPNEPANIQLASKVQHIGGALMLSLILNPPKFKNTLFPAIFRVPSEQVPSLFDIIHHAPNFNELIEKLPKPKVRLLTNALTTDMLTLQKTLKPLSSDNQRRILNFIGLEKILTLGAKDSHLARESDELTFFMTSESLNSVLRRKNHNYLHVMRDRTTATISAKLPHID